MKICAMVAAAVMLGTSAATSAAGFDYSYLDVGYSHQNHNDLSGGNGYQLDGSYAATDTVFIYGNFKHNRFNEFFTYQNDDYQLGLGFHRALNDDADLVARAAFGIATTDVSSSFSSCTFQCTGAGSNVGYDVGLGLRYRPASAWELEAFLDHDTLGFGYAPWGCLGSGVVLNCFDSGGPVDSGDAETAISIGARYSITQPLSVGLRYRHDWLASQSASPQGFPYYFHGPSESMNEWLLDLRWAF